MDKKGHDDIRASFFREDEEFIEPAHKYTSVQIKTLFDPNIGLTLGEIDDKGIFNLVKSGAKLNKGVAGMIVEQCILGYPANSDKRPDITVDDIPTEVKTTGVKKTKKSQGEYVAKEYVSITGVSPKNIVDEIFFESHFWMKLSQLLFVYYHYDSNKVVDPQRYALFKLVGYHIYKFSEKDIVILQNDWEITKKFIQDIHSQYESEDDRIANYPRMTSELRPVLMYVDIAPKMTNQRFRLKGSVVNNIINDYFRKTTQTSLPVSINSFDDLDQLCFKVSRQYGHMTIEEIYGEIHGGAALENISKNISETLTLKMFGSNAKKLNQIDVFAKSGVIGKTIVLTKNGLRTEDMKFMVLNSTDLLDPSKSFDDSDFKTYFLEHQFLFIIFKEKSGSKNFGDNEFIGLKRYYLSDSFIEIELRKTWDDIRRIVFNNKLREVICLDKNGEPIINKNGEVKKTVNFPKSDDHVVFLRGSATDSSKKTMEINGIRMIPQHIWIRGKYIVSELEKTKYL